MKMAYERVDVKKLKFDKRNARKHDKKNIKAIKDSLLKFGQQKPIVVMEDGTVIAGNGTLQAAIELGWDTIDVHWTALKKDEAIAYGLVDNRSAELASWDDDNLKELLSELDASGWDLEGLGWDSEDLKDIIDQKPVEGLTDEDEVPETKQNEFNVALGDIWQLGEHVLMCGDSTDKATVEKLMNGEKADMVFTDPPYGVNEETDRAFASPTRKAKGNTFSKIIGDDSVDTALNAWEICSEQSEIVCYWGGNYYAHKLLPSPCWIVWDKREEENQRDMNSDCELAYVKHPNKKSVRIFRHLWKGMIKASEHGQGRVHPTQKPIALAEWCFNELNEKGKSVLDLFLGSGSTLIACEKTGRKCFGLELDPHYVSVVIKRWQDFTGKQAVKL